MPLQWRDAAYRLVVGVDVAGAPVAPPPLLEIRQVPGSYSVLYCTILYYTVPDPARRVVEAGHLVGGEAAARQDHRVVIIDDAGQAENIAILGNGDRHIDTNDT